ncbi:MAG: hypothetical protein IJW19_01915 [Clostridia bacterium]|nr:hypothetical protein [Clostridia bacterium]
MKGENIFEAMSFIDTELIEDANLQPQKHKKEFFKYKKKIKLKRIGPISAAVVALILCSVILLNNVISPGSSLIGDMTTASGNDVYVPNGDTTTLPGNDIHAPGGDTTTLPDNNIYVPNDALLLTYSVASPSYPIMAKYTSDYNSDEYDEWINALWKQREYYGAGKNLAGFFNNSTQSILGDATTENAVYSPVNVYMTLAMLAEISSGETRQQILDALGAESIEELRIQANSVWNACYRDDGQTASRLASSLWLNENIRYGDCSSLTQNYYASVFHGDMGSDEYSKAYTEWLRKETGGFLDGVIDDEKFDSNTIMVLASTLYFQASWNAEFNKELTKKSVFHSPTGDIQCDFMNQKNGLGTYYYGEMFSATYKHLGNDGMMYFILPDENISISELLSNDEAIAFINNPGTGVNVATCQVNLSLPKFDISMKKDIISDIKALGITECFDGKNANFSEFFPENSPYVTKMEHGVRVSVDEKSCSGAAYVRVDMWGGYPPPEIVDFTLDRPFIFVVTSPDGLPLFIGVVNQPV